MGGVLELFRSAWPWMVFGLMAAGYAAALGMTVAILRQRREPAAMLAWILALVFLPVVGPLFYWLLGEPRIKRRRQRKRRRSAPVSRALEALGTAAGREPAAAPRIDDGVRQLVDSSSLFSPFPLTVGNLVRVLETPEETYTELLAGIDLAEHHVHLEYYIVRNDATGTALRDRLVAKAAAGVEVRLLVDGVGSWSTPRSFFAPLVAAGGKVATFLPALPLRRNWNVNYRNHRKIVVIDGKVGYTGSQNIGDEYRGRWRRVAPWKDTHLRIEGPAAAELQEIFVEDWYFAAEENLARADYFPAVKARGPAPGVSLVQIIPSGLDQSPQTLHELVFLAFSLARQRIRISTAYFVPDPTVVLALKSAARRGVRVELLIPSRTDNHVVLWAGRSYYAELLEAGVVIYEHSTAMLHSKVVSIDDEWALVGSANMDVRSFSLNFEVTASVFDPEISRQLNATIERDCRSARRISLKEATQRSFAVSILEGMARLCAPVL